MPPTLTGIDHIHVFVTDRTAAEAWYSRTLGFERVTSLASWAVGGGPLTLADESGTVHLALFEQPHEKCRSTIALGCTGAELVAWRNYLASALGREVEAVDHGQSWSVYFEDPDGNPFEITSYDCDAVEAARRGP